MIGLCVSHIRTALDVTMTKSIAFAALLLGVLSSCVLAQFNPSKPPAKPVKSDIKYIKCQVCELLAKNAYRQVNDLQKTLKPNKKVQVSRSLRLTLLKMLA